MYAESARVAKSFDGYSTDQTERLKEACKDFEAMFTDMMFKSMRKATEESTLIKKNAGERIFTEMLDSEISIRTARNSSGGLGDMLFEQMKKYLPAEPNGNNFHKEKISDQQNAYKQDISENTSQKSGGISIAI
jgi:flagellar protein FlgJ